MSDLNALGLGYRNEPSTCPVKSNHMPRACLVTFPPGGGAIEMELSRFLRDHSRTIAGKEQLLIGAMAKALEIIPRQLCDNAGFDATNILNKLRQKHAQGKALIHWGHRVRPGFIGKAWGHRVRPGVTR